MGTVIYLDTKSKVKFTIENVAGEQFKINPLNLMELGLTCFSEFISLKDLDKMLKKGILKKLSSN